MKKLIPILAILILLPLFTQASVWSAIQNWWNPAPQEITLGAVPVFSILQGGTSTSTLPQAGQLLIGNSNSKYSVSYLIAGTSTQIATSSGGITIWSTATGGGSTTTINNLSSTNYTFLGVGGVSISTTSPGTITITSSTSTGITLTALSAVSPIVYDNTTGIFTWTNSLSYATTGQLDSYLTITSAATNYVGTSSLTTTLNGYYTTSTINASSSSWTSDIYWTGTATNLMAATGRNSLALGTADTPTFTGLNLSGAGALGLAGAGGLEFGSIAGAGDMVSIYNDTATNTLSLYESNVWGNGGGAMLNLDPLTAYRIFTFPDKAGTFALTSDLTNMATTGYVGFQWASTSYAWATSTALNLLNNYYTTSTINASNTAWLADTLWTGVSTNLVAATGRTSLGLGDSAVLASSTWVKTETDPVWTAASSGYYTTSTATSSFVSRGNWATIDNYPAACTGGQAVIGLTDTLTCSTDNATTGTIWADANIPDTITILNNATTGYVGFTWASTSYAWATATAAKIGTLTNTKWCSSDGSQITCTENAPAGGGVESLNLLTGALTLYGSSTLTVYASGTTGLVIDPGTGGSGITSLAGQTGGVQTFSTSTDTNLGIRINSTGNDHNFLPVWIGTLADARITSGAYWNLAAGWASTTFNAGYATTATAGLTNYYTKTYSDTNYLATGTAASTYMTTFATSVFALDTDVGVSIMPYFATSVFPLKTNNLSDLNSTATARTNLGLVIGTNVQAYDANNATTGSSITGFAGYLASSTWLKVANNLNDGVTSTMRTNLGLVIGTNVMAYEANNATTGSAITGFAGILDYTHGGTGTSTALANQYLWWGDGTGKLVQVASSTFGGASLSGGSAGFIPYWISASTLGFTSISSSTLATIATTGTAVLWTSASTTLYDQAYSQRLQWDGGNTNLVAATGRTSLGLGDSAVLASSTWTTPAFVSTNYISTTTGLTYLTTASSTSNYLYWGSATNTNYAASYNWYNSSSTLHNTWVGWIQSTSTNINANYNWYNSSSTAINLAATISAASSTKWNQAYSALPTGQSGWFPFYNSAGMNLTATSSIIISTSTGYIGIGTTTPSTPFQVYGTTTVKALVVNSNTTATATISIGKGGTATSTACIKLMSSNGVGWGWLTLNYSTGLSLSTSTSCE